MAAFLYREAFSRNLGWLTEQEQELLRNKRVAIAGLGGVGGSHLLTLARLGIGRFVIADPDSFEAVNFNRQAGAVVSTLGRPKAEVMGSLAKDINPGLDLRLFSGGITTENLSDFFQDVDLFIDGLDYFEFDIRCAAFEACRRRGIPAVTVAPLGMGAALLNFLPQGVGFDEYFRFAECDNEADKALYFLMGLSPSMLQMGYLVDPSRIDLASRKGPSTSIAVQLCAGVAGAEALKILLGRGKVYAAPWGVHFDAYKNKLKRTWRPGGNGNPLQKLAIAFAKKQLSKKLG
jgi:molybdopterin/thiamine biosynthesis adenylyltransferase